MLGWIKVHRQLLSWEWFSDTNTLSVFIYLLLSANHKAGKWRGVDVLPGQHITSADTIATHTGLSRQKVRTALGKLKMSGEITVEPTNKYSLITLVKWAVYQHSAEDCNQQPNHEATANQHTGQPSNNHKQECKQIKNDKNAIKETPTNGVEPSEISVIRNNFDFNHDLNQTITAWLTYKQEKRQAYKPSGLNSLLSQIQKYAIQYGDSADIHAITESMASNYQGIVWDKAKTATAATPHDTRNPFFEYARQLEEEERGDYPA